MERRLRPAERSASHPHPSSYRRPALTRCCRCLPFRYAVSEEDKAAKLPPLEGKKPSAGESVRCPPLPNCLPCVAVHLRNTDWGLF